MEALAALGLAGNILQIVDFSTKLVVSVKELASARGATLQNEELEKSTRKLESLLQGLTLDSTPSDRQTAQQLNSVLPESARTAHESRSARHINSIDEINFNCQSLCSKLLEVLEGVKVENGASHRKPKALRAAIKTLLKKEDIKGLQDRLQTQESRLSLCFFPLLLEQANYTTEIAERLAGEGKSQAAQQISSISEVSKQLEDLKKSIHEIRVSFAQATSPRREQRFQPYSTTASAPSHHHIDDIKRVIDSLSSAGQELTLLKKQQSFVRSFHFEGQKARHEGISNSHITTFEWILPNNDSLDSESLDDDSLSEYEKAVRLERLEHATKQQSLSRWLETGTGIFWINGIPGCGKSTLMKFIADHEKTREALKTWSEGKDLVIAAHYFWITGSVLQKSEKGLLLQLLFDVLRHYPALSQDIFLDRFQNWDGGFSAESLASRAEDTWTIEELREALDRLAKHSSLPIRVCFFIDGLDEYDGDHFKLCRMLKGFESSSSVKFCVSSRPWNVFEKAFGADPATTLCVHDFTYNDIKRFAEDHLRETSDLHDLHIGQSDIEEMSRYITKTAQGVFLWVVLATKDLRDGLVDDNPVGDLWRRLKLFPPELDPFFKRVLENIHYSYQRYMAECFLMLSHIDWFKNVRFLFAHSLEEHDPDYALHPSEADVRSALDLPNKQITSHFNARFGGLLSVNLLFSEVDFIHRTVHDFLLREPMQEYLKEKAAHPFHCHLSALKAMLLFLRGELLSPSTSIVGDALFTLTEKAMTEDSDETIKLLDICTEMISEPAFCSSLKSQIFMHFYIGSPYGLALADSGSTTTGNTKSDILRKLSLRRCFQEPCKYRAAKLKRDKDYFNGYENSSFDPALRWMDADQLHSLLIRGANPNERLFVYRLQSCPTPWHMVLVQSDINKRSLPILCSFLQHGASRTCDVRDGVLPFRHAISRLQINRQGIRKYLRLMVDAFLETSAEENQIQLADAMFYADASQYSAEERDRMTRTPLVRAFEYVLSKAMDIGLPLASFDPVVKNDLLRRRMSPETVARFDAHIASLRDGTHLWSRRPGVRDIGVKPVLLW